MLKFIKKYSIQIAFLLPIISIGLFIIISTIPGYFIKTEYKFVYATVQNNSNYNYNPPLSSILKVTNNKISYSENLNETFNTYNTSDNYLESIEYYIYDDQNKTNTKISFNEAQNLTINSNPKSPDGLTFNQYNSYNNFFLIPTSGHLNQVTLNKNRIAKNIKLNINQNNNYYNFYDHFLFLGWITE